LGDPHPGGAWVEERLLPKFDGLFCISRATANAAGATRQGRGSALVGHAHCGLDGRFSPGSKGLPARLKLTVGGDDSPLFLFVGSLIRRKNVSWLIQEVFAPYCASNPGRLIIAGEGEEAEKLRAMISSLNLSGRIHLLGRISDEERLALYRSASAVLFPSLMEGFGFVPAEAMACGTPVIVSNRGSLPEIVDDGTTGYVLPLESGPEPWITAMKMLAENASVRSELGLAAAEVVRRRFNWDTNARETAAFYREVIQRYWEAH
jgi:glycosyltransferase involved in cell wall biosynthesis